MLTVRIADLHIELDNRYRYTETMCRDYITPPPPVHDLRVHVSSQEVSHYIAACGRPMTPPEAEFHLLYRRICERMPAFDGVLLHAAVVEMDGRGYAFSARRGVGKSTHTALWQAHFAGRAAIINGDKPLIRRAADGIFWAYGTPWCGKEGKQQNRKCPLTAICFLEQAAENRVTPATTADTVARLLEATLLPPAPADQDRMAALIGAIVRKTPAYTLACRPDTAAAELAYEFLTQQAGGPF